MVIIQLIIMSKDLSHLRDSLRKTMSKAWEDPAFKAFKDVLSEIMEIATKDDFRDCMSGKMPDDIKGEIFYKCKVCYLPAPVTCLTLVARKYGLDKKFEEAWKAIPRQLKQELMGIENLWTKNDRAMAEAVAGTLDISGLYHLCVQAEYTEVSKRLGMDFVPTVYRDCMSCVAKYTNLAAAYKKMWGK